jgi:hypothetical protein
MGGDLRRASSKNGAMEGMALTKKTYELYGMTGQLAVYNGTKARCYHSAAVGGELSPTWHIPINNKLTLELPRKFLRELSQFDYPVVETSGWQSIMQSLEQNANTNSCQAYTSNNRTDVGATCASLVAQLRNVLLKRAGGGKHGSNTVEVQQIKDLFAEMDSDHNGELDKKEFLHGCLNVGIRISPQELNLVWPLFDSDGSGTIDTDELTAFLEDQRKRQEVVRKVVARTLSTRLVVDVAEPIVDSKGRKRTPRRGDQPASPPPKGAV